MKFQFGIILLGVLLLPEILFSQGRDSRWLVGYYDIGVRPYTGSDLVFHGGAVDTFYHFRYMSFLSTATNISDNVGNLLFYTNGIWIADRNDSLMQNGDHLNPSAYTTSQANNNYGLNLAQSHIIIPKPGDSSQYIMFHLTMDTDFAGQIYSRYLYYSVIDMSLNSGNGAVVIKNSILLDDQIVCGGLAAVKHANGRDWWILGHQSFTTRFIEYLVTPDSILGPYFQDIGVIRIESEPTGVFSTDGTRYALMDGNHELDVFDFDRCFGILSNCRHSVTNHNLNSSVAFSHSGNYLYLTDTYHVYQYDLLNSQLDSGKVLVAEWDSTYDPMGPPFATLFWICRLAPNNKIYISTGNGTIYLHVINSPDSAGLACDVRQHALTLPTYNFNSIPYFPNYSLSQITGSICDSLTLSSTDHSPPLYEKEINVFPNPAERVLYVSVAGHKPFHSMAIFNSLGTEMSCNTTLLKHDEYIEFNILNLIPGVYFVELSGEKEKVVRRFVKL